MSNPKSEILSKVGVVPKGLLRRKGSWKSKAPASVRDPVGYRKLNELSSLFLSMKKQGVPPPPNERIPVQGHISSGWPQSPLSLLHDEKCNNDLWDNRIRSAPGSASEAHEGPTLPKSVKSPGLRGTSLLLAAASGRASKPGVLDADGDLSRRNLITAVKNSVRRDKLKRRRSRRDPGRKQGCLRCGGLETPEWRRGPDGTMSLCNACGLYFAKIVKKEMRIKAQTTLSPISMLLN